MENIIDFNNAARTSINSRYDGTYKDETGDYEYMVLANYNQWDDWSIRGILWVRGIPKNQKEIELMIHNKFKKTMYGE